MALGQYHGDMEPTAPQDTESRHADKYIVRFPDGMRDQLKEAAKASNRTMNAEIVARLQSSLEGAAVFPFAIDQAIEHEQEERGGSREDALARLVLAGQAQGGTVLHVVMPKKVTIKEFGELLRASEKVIPPDANMIVERR